MVQRYTIIYAHKIYKDLSVFYQDARSIIEILINRAKRPRRQSADLSASPENPGGSLQRSRAVLLCSGILTFDP